MNIIVRCLQFNFLYVIIKYCIMKKIVLSFIVLFFFSYNLISQNLTVSAVAAQGGLDQSEGLIIEWTLGENLTETVRSANKILTQGFHQPHLKTLKINEERLLSLGHIRIYPNPVYSILNIQLHKDFSTHYTINLFDINGRIIKYLNVSENANNIEFDMSDLSSGIYLLKISDVFISKSNTYRIIKH